MKPVSLWRTRFTSPNCPFPIFLPIQKSDFENFRISVFVSLFWGVVNCKGVTDGSFIRLDGTMALGWSRIMLSNVWGDGKAALGLLLRLIPRAFNKFSSVLPLELSTNGVFFLNIPVYWELSFAGVVTTDVLWTGVASLAETTFSSFFDC